VKPSVNINVESGVINFNGMEHPLPITIPKKRITSASVRNTGRVLNNTMGNMNMTVARKNRN